MADLPKTTRAWELTNKTNSLPSLTGPEPTFTLKTIDVPPLSDNQILIKTQYISNDPAQRVWIEAGVPAEKSYVTIQTGQPMLARIIGEVIAGGASDGSIKKGDIVRGWLSWSEYIVVDLNKQPSAVQVLQPVPGLDMAHYLGALGNTGMAAYYGLVGVSQAKKGEKIVVSGAAGATGSMVVQIAKKLVGASNVVGIAGTDEKCRWVESIGADKCINYKSKTFEADLIEATKDGVDVYFDNVGGEILNLVLARMNSKGRVAACGAIAGYNSGTGNFHNNLTNWTSVVLMRLRIEGFIELDQTPEEAAETTNILRDAIVDEKISISDESHTLVNGSFEDVPKTWLRLFEGQNTGKLVTKLKHN